MHYSNRPRSRYTVSTLVRLSPPFPRPLFGIPRRVLKLITLADFGQSYASQSLDKATEFYHSEIECVNAAATVARSLGGKGQWVLSVGATPTAHAATQIKDGQMDLEGELEL